MNNVKLISSGIFMLISFLAAGQEKELKYIPKNGGVHCRLSLQVQKDTLYTLNNIMVNKELIKELNPENIKSITVLDKEKGQSLYGSQGRNGVVIIQTDLANRKISRMIKKHSIKQVQPQ
jgi:hypothetical protein